MLALKIILVVNFDLILRHFALTIGLLPALKDGFKQSGRHSRVVNVSSLAHVRGDVEFDDINFKTREYEPFVAYGQSKTANILFSVSLTKHHSHEGIYSNALNKALWSHPFINI